MNLFVLNPKVSQLTSSGHHRTLPLIYLGFSKSSRHAVHDLNKQKPKQTLKDDLKGDVHVIEVYHTSLIRTREEARVQLYA